MTELRSTVSRARSQTGMPASKGRRPIQSSNLRARCYRCNQEGHYARDPMCPARSETCERCEMVGQFAVCCRTQSRQRVTNKKTGGRKPKGRGSRRLNALDTSSSDDWAVDEFTFMVTDADVNAIHQEGRVNLTVGGALLEDAIIDCVDMHQANQAVIREHHPIPTFENVLENMHGSLKDGLNLGSTKLNSMRRHVT